MVEGFAMYGIWDVENPWAEKYVGLQGISSALLAGFLGGL